MFFELREIDGAAIESRRGAGLEPLQLEAESVEFIGERAGGAFARSASRCLSLPGVHHRLQKRASGHHDGGGGVDRIAADPHSRDPVVLDHLQAWGAQVATQGAAVNHIARKLNEAKLRGRPIPFTDDDMTTIRTCTC